MNVYLLFLSSHLTLGVLIELVSVYLCLVICVVSFDVVSLLVYNIYTRINHPGRLKLSETAGHG